MLINDAGIIQIGPVEQMSIQDFEDALAVHLWGPIYTTVAMRLMNRLLPSLTSVRGDFARNGWESQSTLAKSLLTRLADQAAQDNNGLRWNSPPF